jgi:biopolymer transport protein ExbB
MGSSSGRLQAYHLTFIGMCLAVALFVTVPETPWQSTARADGETATPAPTDPGASAPTEKRNLFWHIVISAGPVFGPLLLFVSVGLVALIVLLTLDLRMGVAIPPGFVEEFTDTINKRKFKEAFDLARNDNSFVSRVITAGMGRLQYGIEDAREATFGMIETIKASKEQLITYLSTIGTLGPMLGLVGTVFGMIIAFMALGVKGQQPNTAELAGGISHALVITLLGVALSVPAIFFHAFFRNRLIRISMDVSNVADDLLTQMYHNSKKPAPPGAPPGPGAPAPAMQNVQPVAR